MTYSLSCHMPDKLIYLTLDGQCSLEELQAANQEVMTILDASSVQLCIVFDVNNLVIDYLTSAHLRMSQAYLNHEQLELAMIITDNKLNRLVTMMAFSKTNTRMVQYHNYQQAEENLKRRGFMQGSAV